MNVRERFRSLHENDTGFVIPNPWDAGSARILASLGFAALATTSGGHAGSLGRRDGGVSREEALAHAAEIVAATPLPVSADLENGFGDAPELVAETVELASAAGLAGCSIEDYSGEALYGRELSVERVRAAVEASRAPRNAGIPGEAPLVVTARSENFIRGNPELGDTVERLQAYQQVGADVLYAPGLTDLDAIRTLVSETDRPVNVLIMPGGPSVTELFEAGVKRVSTGTALALAANAALIEGAKELLERGTHEFWLRAVPAMGAVNAAYSDG